MKEKIAELEEHADLKKQNAEDNRGFKSETPTSLAASGTVALVEFFNEEFSEDSEHTFLFESLYSVLLQLA